MTGHPFLLHGLRLQSPVPLAATTATQPGADVVVSRQSLDEPATGTVLLSLDDPDAGRSFTLAQVGSGYRLTFPGAACLRVDGAISRVDVTAHDDDLLSVLLGGPVAVVLAQLRGHTLLHASALHTAGGALAIVGQRGQGKSTIAHLACGPDVALLSDDALRVDLSGDGVEVHRGTTTSRLRSAAGIGRSLAGASRSADGRLLAKSLQRSPATSALRAIVVPRLLPGATELRLSRLTTSESVGVLLSSSPLGAEGPSDWTRRHFETCVAVAARIPAFELAVPWYSGAGEDLGAKLREGLSALAAGGTS